MIKTSYDYKPFLETVQKKLLDLFCKKNADYGNAFESLGPVGVIARLLDKFNRFLVISKNSVSVVDDESLRDTLLDAANYAMLAYIMLTVLEDSDYNDGDKRVPGAN